MLMKIFNPISSKILAIASQKLVSRILLANESPHNNRDIFYDEMVLNFCMNTTAKPHVKRLSVSKFTYLPRQLVTRFGVLRRV